MTQDTPQLLSDSALDDPEEDQLGYADFAEKISNAIYSDIPSDEFVVGIYGQWGSGKSTIINFIEHELRQKDEPPIIVRFNPWWFSGQSDLIQKFFSQLSAGLEMDDNFEEIRNKLSDYARGFSKIPLSTVGIPTEKPAEGLANLLETDPPDLDELKADISDALEEENQQIVVFIDDIDRLTQEEIRQMFRLVKSVADFPNIIYVLAFDQDVVTKALESNQGVNDGKEYLDKIIQLPQQVPLPEENALHFFLTERLDEILHSSDLYFDQSHWQEVYRKGIQPLIDTPRDAVRLSNAVYTTHLGLEDEVNFVDLVALETVRLYFSPVYEEIRSNPDRFVRKRTLSHTADENHADLWEETEVNEEPLKSILEYLFPRIDTDVRVRYTEHSDTYRKRRRICHPEIFPYYFRQTLPKGELSSEEIVAILAITDDAETLTERLEELAEENGERSKANNFLKRISKRTEDINDEAAMVKSLYRVGDYLTTVDPSKNALDDGSRGFIIRIIWEILGQIEDKDDRLELLKSSFAESDSPYLLYYTVNKLLREHGEVDGDEIEDSEKMLDRDQVEELKTAAVRRFEELAEERELLTEPQFGLGTPRIGTVVENWSEWSPSDKPEEWANNVTDDEEGLIRFVGNFVLTGRSGSTEIEYLDPRWLDSFADLDEIKGRLSEIEESSLDSKEKHVVETFQQGMELLENGKDPSSFEVWTLGTRS
ncbi:KAP family P-loop NTPase fold protein [Halapricum desulfuricans]|uniref:KAP-like P-loop ATPase n=1 Tax=Halapricum desulfuricans TaxID=2841257 RepID=A0A897NQ55_9EURY|nr:KAP family NTPase [Halapricum desulfuricans]QSG14361.1 KAP-like P-loop ATPase [Halapricum desulfuricans]